MNKLTIFDIHSATRDYFYDKQPEKYISIDEGWYKLVYDCHDELKSVDPLYRILQIKEKFGLLRFYVEPSPEYIQSIQFDKGYIRAIIAKYESLSGITCEATGGSGVLMRSFRGNLKTLDPVWALQSSVFNNYVQVNKE